MKHRWVRKPIIQCCMANPHTAAGTAEGPTTAPQHDWGQEEGDAERLIRGGGGVFGEVWGLHAQGGRTLAGGCQALQTVAYVAVEEGSQTRTKPAAPPPPLGNPPP